MPRDACGTPLSQRDGVDATGFAVQPGKLDGGPRRPCRKGHCFVRIADRYQRSEDVVALFKGYAAGRNTACLIQFAEFGLGEYTYDELP